MPYIEHNHNGHRRQEHESERGGGAVSPLRSSFQNNVVRVSGILSCVSVLIAPLASARVTLFPPCHVRRPNLPFAHSPSLSEWLIELGGQKSIHQTQHTPLKRWHRVVPRVAHPVFSPGVGRGSSRAQPGGVFTREYSCASSDGDSLSAMTGSSFHFRKHPVPPGFIPGGTHGGRMRLSRRATQSTFRNHLWHCFSSTRDRRPYEEVGQG